ncbi:class I SAM-dependent methyltransferase [Gordoniibacillus kamchatkensis]|uniref:class I SAM-dependent methyltransferase n=1 Tax=Gordoniibacillus kamchatkensis TaxID=1590651 RepID=UPI001E30AFB4|nr:class I SAM-dependent methyltransferase [Paenibacillus sp. VKM B-2647]
MLATMNCICGAEAALKYSLKNDVYYCKNCELFFAPDTKFNLSFKSTLDERLRIEALKSLRELNFHKILDELRIIIPSDSIGLEVGSSYGWFLKLATARGINCIGVEPERKIWEISKEEGFEVINGFFPDDLPAEYHSFDFIIFNDVLEHIPNVNYILTKCYELLKPNGILVINIPQSTGFFYRTAHFLYKIGVKTYMNRLWQFDFHSPHLYYFNSKNLTSLLTCNHFDVFKYHKLDTLDIDSIDQRIKYDSLNKGKSSFITGVIKLLLPFVNHLNEDIGCYYARKNN